MSKNREEWVASQMQQYRELMLRQRQSSRGGSGSSSQVAMQHGSKAHGRAASSKSVHAQRPASKSTGPTPGRHTPQSMSPPGSVLGSPSIAAAPSPVPWKPGGPTNSHHVLWLRTNPLYSPPISPRRRISTASAASMVPSTHPSMSQYSDMMPYLDAHGPPRQMLRPQSTAQPSHAAAAQPAQAALAGRPWGAGPDMAAASTAPRRSSSSSGKSSPTHPTHSSPHREFSFSHLHKSGSPVTVQKPPKLRAGPAWYAPVTPIPERINNHSGDGSRVNNTVPPLQQAAAEHSMHMPAQPLGGARQQQELAERSQLPSPRPSQSSQPPPQQPQLQPSQPHDTGMSQNGAADSSRVDTSRSSGSFLPSRTAASFYSTAAGTAGLAGGTRSPGAAAPAVALHGVGKAQQGRVDMGPTDKQPAAACGGDQLPSAAAQKTPSTHTAPGAQAPATSAATAASTVSPPSSEPAAQTSASRQASQRASQAAARRTSPLFSAVPPWMRVGSAQPTSAPLPSNPLTPGSSAQPTQSQPAQQKATVTHISSVAVAQHMPGPPAAPSDPPLQAQAQGSGSPGATAGTSDTYWRAWATRKGIQLPVPQSTAASAPAAHSTAHNAAPDGAQLPVSPVPESPLSQGSPIQPHAQFELHPSPSEPDASGGPPRQHQQLHRPSSPPPDRHAAEVGWHLDSRAVAILSSPSDAEGSQSEASQSTLPSPVAGTWEVAGDGLHAAHASEECTAESKGSHYSSVSAAGRVLGSIVHLGKQLLMHPQRRHESHVRQSLPAPNLPPAHTLDNSQIGQMYASFSAAATLPQGSGVTALTMATGQQASQEAELGQHGSSTVTRPHSHLPSGTMKVPQEGAPHQQASGWRSSLDLRSSPDRAPESGSRPLSRSSKLPDSTDVEHGSVAPVRVVQGKRHCSQESTSESTDEEPEQAQECSVAEAGVAGTRGKRSEMAPAGVVQQHSMRTGAMRGARTRSMLALHSHRVSAESVRSWQEAPRPQSQHVQQSLDCGSSSSDSESDESEVQLPSGPLPHLELAGSDTDSFVEPDEPTLSRQVTLQAGLAAASSRANASRRQSSFAFQLPPTVQPDHQLWQQDVGARSQSASPARVVTGAVRAVLGWLSPGKQRRRQGMQRVQSEHQSDSPTQGSMEHPPYMAAAGQAVQQRSSAFAQRLDDQQASVSLSTYLPPTLQLDSNMRASLLQESGLSRRHSSRQSHLNPAPRTQPAASQLNVTASQGGLTNSQVSGLGAREARPDDTNGVEHGTQGGDARNSRRLSSQDRGIPPRHVPGTSHKGSLVARLPPSAIISPYPASPLLSEKLALFFPDAEAIVAASQPGTNATPSVAPSSVAASPRPRLARKHSSSSRESAPRHDWASNQAPFNDGWAARPTTASTLHTAPAKAAPVPGAERAAAAAAGRIVGRRGLAQDTGRAQQTLSVRQQAASLLRSSRASVPERLQRQQQQQPSVSLLQGSSGTIAGTPGHMHGTPAWSRVDAAWLLDAAAAAEGTMDTDILEACELFDVHSSMLSQSSRPSPAMEQPLLGAELQALLHDDLGPVGVSASWHAPAVAVDRDSGRAGGLSSWDVAGEPESVFELETSQQEQASQVGRKTPSRVRGAGLPGPAQQQQQTGLGSRVGPAQQPPLLCKAPQPLLSSQQRAPPSQGVPPRPAVPVGGAQMAQAGPGQSRAAASNSLQEPDSSSDESWTRIHATPIGASPTYTVPQPEPIVTPPRPQPQPRLAAIIADVTSPAATGASPAHRGRPVVPVSRISVTAGASNWRMVELLDPYEEGAPPVSDLDVLPEELTVPEHPSHPSQVAAASAAVPSSLSHQTSSTLPPFSLNQQGVVKEAIRQLPNGTPMSQPATAGCDESDSAGIASSAPVSAQPQLAQAPPAQALAAAAAAERRPLAVPALPAGDTQECATVDAMEHGPQTVPQQAVPATPASQLKGLSGAGAASPAAGSVPVSLRTGLTPPAARRLRYPAQGPVQPLILPLLVLPGIVSPRRLAEARLLPMRPTQQTAPADVSQLAAGKPDPGHHLPQGPAASAVLPSHQGPVPLQAVRQAAEVQVSLCEDGSQARDVSTQVDHTMLGRTATVQQLRVPALQQATQPPAFTELPHLVQQDATTQSGPGAAPSEPSVLAALEQGDGPASQIGGSVAATGLAADKSAAAGSSAARSACSAADVPAAGSAGPPCSSAAALAAVSGAAAAAPLPGLANSGAGPCVAPQEVQTAQKEHAGIGAESQSGPAESCAKHVPASAPTVPADEPTQRPPAPCSVQPLLDAHKQRLGPPINAPGSPLLPLPPPPQARQRQQQQPVSAQQEPPPVRALQFTSADGDTATTAAEDASRGSQVQQAGAGSHQGNTQQQQQQQHQDQGQPSPCHLTISAHGPAPKVVDTEYVAPEPAAACTAVPAAATAVQAQPSSPADELVAPSLTRCFSSGVAAVAARAQPAAALPSGAQVQQRNDEPSYPVATACEEPPATPVHSSSWQAGAESSMPGPALQPLNPPAVHSPGFMATAPPLPSSTPRPQAIVPTQATSQAESLPAVPSHPSPPALSQPQPQQPLAVAPLAATTPPGLLHCSTAPIAPCEALAAAARTGDSSTAHADVATVDLSASAPGPAATASKPAASVSSSQGQRPAGVSSPARQALRQLGGLLLQGAAVAAAGVLGAGLMQAAATGERGSPAHTPAPHTCSPGRGVTRVNPSHIACNEAAWQQAAAQASQALNGLQVGRVSSQVQGLLEGCLSQLANLSPRAAQPFSAAATAATPCPEATQHTPATGSKNTKRTACRSPTAPAPSVPSPPPAPGNSTTAGMGTSVLGVLASSAVHGLAGLSTAQASSVAAGALRGLGMPPVTSPVTCPSAAGGMDHYPAQQQLQDLLQQQVAQAWLPLPPPPPQQQQGNRPHETPLVSSPVASCSPTSNMQPQQVRVSINGDALSGDSILVRGGSQGRKGAPGGKVGKAGDVSTALEQDRGGVEAASTAKPKRGSRDKGGAEGKESELGGKQEQGGGRVHSFLHLAAAEEVDVVVSGPSRAARLRGDGRPAAMAAGAGGSSPPPPRYRV